PNDRIADELPWDVKRRSSPSGGPLDRYARLAESLGIPQDVCAGCTTPERDRRRMLEQKQRIRAQAPRALVGDSVLDRETAPIRYQSESMPSAALHPCVSPPLVGAAQKTPRIAYVAKCHNSLCISKTSPIATIRFPWHQRRKSVHCASSCRPRLGVCPPTRACCSSPACC